MESPNVEKNSHLFQGHRNTRILRRTNYKCLYYCGEVMNMAAVSIKYG